MKINRVEQLAEGITCYLGDCREIMPTVGMVNAVVTDPPYGIDLDGYEDRPENVKNEIVPRIIQATRLTNVTSTSITPGVRNMYAYPEPTAVGCVFYGNGIGIGRWGFECYHPILYYGKDPYLMGGQGSRPNSIYPRNWPTEKIDHPCPKPVAWMKWMVERTSLDGWMVLDPFMGSGTTGIACVKLGRKFVGIEREAKYFDIACQRIENAINQPDLFIAPIQSEALI